MARSTSRTSPRRARSSAAGDSGPAGRSLRPLPRPALLRQPPALGGLEGRVTATLLRGPLLLALVDGGREERVADGTHCREQNRARARSSATAAAAPPRRAAASRGAARRRASPDHAEAAAPAQRRRLSCRSRRRPRRARRGPRPRSCSPRPSGPCTFQRESARAGQTSQMSTPTALSSRPAARPGFSP